MVNRNNGVYWLISAVVVAFMASGCSMFSRFGSQSSGSSSPSSSGAANASNAPLGDATPGLDANPHLRYKKVRLLRSDFSTALQLPGTQLCSEDGADCFNNYNTSLGGHDLDLGIFTTSEMPIVTTPIAVERIAMQACIKRVNADFAGSPVIFSGVSAGATTYTPAMAAAGVQLYHGFLRRDPTSGEASALQQLFTAVSSKAPAGQAGQTWATLACWNVATTLESVLY